MSKLYTIVGVVILSALLSGCDKNDLIMAAGKSLTIEEAQTLLEKQEERIEQLKAENAKLKTTTSKQARMQEDVARLKSMLVPPEKS